MILAIDRAWAPDDAPPASTHRVVVTDALIADLRRQQHDALGRAPTEAERAAAVERWIHDEVLVREARRRGLDVADPVIRGRLAIKMAELFDAREVPGAPDEAALRALYDTHRAAYRVATRLTLRQLFVAGSPDDEGARQRAEALRLRAASGEDPRALAADGDPPPGGPVLRGRRPARLIEQYGPAFVEGLAQAPLDTWLLRPSPSGWHVVRIERRQPGRQLSFDEARNRVQARWTREARARGAAAAIEALRAAYRVEGWPRPASGADD